MRTESHSANLLRRALLVTIVLSPIPLMAQPKTLIEVWKTPACGCCKDWVSHLEANGFEVTTHDVSDTSSVRQRNRIPDAFGSCHSAVVGEYVLEGHVPAREITRLLKEKPNAVGLAVPSMPLGSPGMDGPDYGGRHMAYDVLLVLPSGKAEVYQSYT
ncbi:MULTISPECIES: DUF411 domain-containing protein [Achromobacter]|uniref:Metal-binding protein n=1 Tax=Achromobacter spanius TaxID=217203 RepID=A0AAW3HVH6_9BURK|nr:metal-binding protein [Achromobacter denitrificans]KNE23123.1 metal-binding protein [Achromobacter spanius]